MRVIILGQPETSVPDSAVRLAYELVQTLGREETHDLIVTGIRSAESGRSDVVDGWVELAQGIEALTHATRH
ncbi:hypothetical protein SAMN05428950_101893 [Sphingomonas sp. OV641]|uniref:hypothetical protein n=1 Tax=Sphingomonas sp. OV641 TaxID=1881068 RepID=UPI0008B543E3|nr:hypothetical protein [Sphingomonas sp. OV641]SEJ02785.1 hypothetical protein SAMN05428950_101893 [Sphingomonas sp. OV641]